MIIKDLETAAQAGARIVEVKIHCTVRHSNHPENVVHVDVHVVVVDLLGQSDRTGVQVKSDKGKSAVMMAAIGTDELALADAHVCLVRERLGRARHGVGSSPDAADVCQPDKPVEVRDLRWVVEAGKREGGVQWVVVDEDPEGSKWRAAPGIGLGWPKPSLLA